MTRRLAIIPARGGSTRIPGKNIVDFCGRPLIAYSLEAARASELFDTIHVSTDSHDVADVARREGGDVDFLRNPDLGENQVSITTVLRWVIEEYSARGQQFDDVCLLMATTPLLTGEDLESGYAAFVSQNRNFPLLSVASFPAPVERAMIIGDDGLLRFTTPDLRTRHSQDLQTQYFDAGAFAFFTSEQLTASDEAVYTEYTPYILDRYKATDINEPEDLEFAELLYRGLQERRRTSGNA